MKRIAQLDGVRGIAILLILIWHYLECQILPAPGSFAWSLHQALRYTWSGVDLFFVLSGFLIGGILLDNRDTSNYFRIFYLRRICRILPLYYLSLALFMVFTATALSRSEAFEWLFSGPLPIWSYATFTQNILISISGDFGANWLGVTWSLAIEEQFYLFVPVLIYFLQRRTLVFVLVVAVVFAPILRCDSAPIVGVVNTLWRSDSLLSGVCLAILVRWDPFVSAVHRHRRAFMALSLLILAGSAVMVYRTPPFDALNLLWLATFYCVFVLMAYFGPDSILGRSLASPPLVWLGTLSYAIYMFHQPVSGLLYGLLRQRLPQIHSVFDAGITLLALCITLLLAVISYRFFEGPVLRYGHRYPYTPKVQSAVGE